MTDDDVKACLEKATEIVEQYRIYALHPRDLRSLDDLQWILATYLERAVDIFDLRIPTDDNRVVRGMFVAKKDGSYMIFRLADLGDRERRFVTCKEMFHVILDSEKCRNMDIIGHLEAAQVSFSIDDSSPDDAVKLEVLAEIGAMEFLFPYSKRLEELAADADNPDFGRIAAHYGVPQVYVEQYLSDHYMAELGAFHPVQQVDDLDV